MSTDNWHNAKAQRAGWDSAQRKQHSERGRERPYQYMTQPNDTLRELATILAQAIAMRLRAILGVEMLPEVDSDADSYIILFKAEVPNTNPPRQWAAEVRGSFKRLFETRANLLSTEEIVGYEVDAIVAGWRRDNQAQGGQAGVDNGLPERAQPKS